MDRRPALLIFAIAASVVVFQIACPIVLLSQGSQLGRGEFAVRSDAARYRTIVESPGRPYRDFDVEYPPLAVGLFRSLGAKNFDGFRQRLVLLQIACQALIVFLLFKVWGRRTMWSYLVLSAPMLYIVYVGFDLVVVALAVCGAALMHRSRHVVGALAIVVGAFVKVWPVVLLPGLLVRRQFRASALRSPSASADSHSGSGGAGRARPHRSCRIAVRAVGSTRACRVRCCASSPEPDCGSRVDRYASALRPAR